MGIKFWSDSDICKFSAFRQLYRGRTVKCSEWPYVSYPRTLVYIEKIKDSVLIIFFTSLSTLLISCENKNKEKDPLENPSDYYEVQGRIYKVQTYFDWRYLEKSRDIYYEYYLGNKPPMKGEITHTTLMGLRKGDNILVIVNKKDSTESFFNGRGFMGDKILEFDRNLKK